MSWTPKRCDGCDGQEDTFDLLLHVGGSVHAFCRLACLLRWMRMQGYGIDDEREG